MFRYTREAGVRSLERKIGAICRAVAVKVAEGHKMSRPESSSESGPGTILKQFQLLGISFIMSECECVCVALFMHIILV